jgi:hypothetical protein
MFGFKKLSILSFFLLFFYCCTLSAQVSTRSSRDRDEESRSELKNRLWYGGNLQLGFTGFNGGNVFAFGLAPMVGFKIIPKVSIGPRVSALLNSIKVPGYKSTGFWDVDAGVFLRIHLFQGLFAQGELSNQWVQYPIYGSGTRLDKITEQRPNQRIGLGWNFGQGGTWGSELGVFYNVAAANDVAGFQNPWEYRFGFTYGF